MAIIATQVSLTLMHSPNVDLTVICVYNRTVLAMEFGCTVLPWNAFNGGLINRDINLDIHNIRVLNVHN